jgi:MSHA biogenesis protein MshO
VVAVLASTLIGRQMQGYVDTAARAELVGKADAALDRMARDLRAAAPYSVRVTGNALEWVPITGFGRYRKYPTAGSGDILDFASADDRFDVFGPMPALAAGQRLLIGNSAAPASGFNLYQAVSDGSILPAGSHVVSSAAITASVSGSQVVLSAPFQFSQDSIASRFYVIAGAASYICDPGVGTITRYAGYAVQSTQPGSGSVPPLSSSGTQSALLVDGVAGCQFGYTALNALHGLVTLQLQLTANGETISLVRFVHVENRP